MNTKIEYTYRDASNYKQHETVIVAGTVTREQLLQYCAHESDDNNFIPSQVGLEDLQPRMTSFPSADDHVWHELDEVEPTEAEPSCSLTADELLANFKAASTDWEIGKAMDRLGLT